MKAINWLCTFVVLALGGWTLYEGILINLPKPVLWGIAVVLVVIILAILAVWFWIKAQASKIKMATKGVKVAARILGATESPVAEERTKTEPTGGIRRGPVLVTVILLVVIVAGLGWLFGPQLGLPELFDKGKAAVSEAQEGWSRSEEVGPGESTGERAPAPTTKAKKAVPTATQNPSQLVDTMVEVFTALRDATTNGKEDPFTSIATAKLVGGEKFADLVRADIQSLADTTKGVEKQAAKLALQWWDALVAGKTKEAEQIATEMEDLLPALAQLGDEGPTALTAIYKGKSSPSVAAVATVPARKASSAAGPTPSSIGGSSVTYRSSTPVAPRVKEASIVAPTAAAVKFLKGSEMVSRSVAAQRGTEILVTRGMRDPDKVEQEVNKILDQLAKIAEKGTYLDIEGNFQNWPIGVPTPMRINAVGTPAPVPTLTTVPQRRKSTPIKLPLAWRTPVPTVPPTPRWINPTAYFPPTPVPTVPYPLTPTPIIRGNTPTPYGTPPPPPRTPSSTPDWRTPQITVPNWTLTPLARPGSPTPIQL